MRLPSSMACVAMVLLLATACGESPNPPEPSSCGPMSCDGCCNAGTCQPGTSVLACGQGGAACSACGAGKPCEEGTCRQPTADDGGVEEDAGTDAGTDGGAPDAGPQHTFILFDPRGPQPVIPEPNDLRIRSRRGCC